VVVEVVPPPGAVLTRVDPKIVARLLARLMGHATSRGASVVSVDAGPSPDGTHLEVVVSDNGASLAEAVRGTLFDQDRSPESSPGHRPGENGLALAYCRLAVEAHGGRIGVSSGPAEGTVFRLLLPAAAAVRTTTGAVALPS
jgi:signal transduction histidine kinase